MFHVYYISGNVPDSLDIEMKVRVPLFQEVTNKCGRITNELWCNILGGKTGIGYRHLIFSILWDDYTEIHDPASTLPPPCLWHLIAISYRVYFIIISWPLSLCPSPVVIVSLMPHHLSQGWPLSIPPNISSPPPTQFPFFFLSLSFFNSFLETWLAYQNPQTFNAHNLMGLDLCIYLGPHHHNQGHNTSTTFPSFLCPFAFFSSSSFFL